MATGYITLITPDGESIVTEIEARGDGRTFSLPWLHPTERMNGQWTIAEIGKTFEIKLPYNDAEFAARRAGV